MNKRERSRGFLSIVNRQAEGHYIINRQAEGYTLKKL